jgi:dipeptidyl aminopeptidase/acylaminoacyl peptidase
VFPGENHSLTRTGLMHNRIRHMLEIRRWMEKYLNGREATP